MIDFHEIEEACNVFIELICKKMSQRHGINYLPFKISGVEYNTQYPTVISYCRLARNRVFIGIHGTEFPRFSQQDQLWAIAHEACHAFVMRTLRVFGTEKEHHGPEWQECMTAIGMPLQFKIKRV